MSQKLQQVEGVAARRTEGPSQVDKTLSLALTPLNRQELVRFGLAGWQLVPASSEGEGLRHVYRDEAGHLVIEGQHVTMRLKPGISPGEVPGILNEYNLELVRPVGLKRDMFQVAPAAKEKLRPDLVELCRTMEEDERIAWAEPSLIESVQKR